MKLRYISPLIVAIVVKQSKSVATNGRVNGNKRDGALVCIILFICFVLICIVQHIDMDFMSMR